MDDEKWKKAVDKTEEVVFGYCALRENRKARKASRKARYRSLKQQKGRVRALLHMVGEGIIFAHRKTGDSNDCTVEFRTGTVRV